MEGVDGIRARKERGRGWNKGKREGGDGTWARKEGEREGME